MLHQEPSHLLLILLLPLVLLLFGGGRPSSALQQECSSPGAASAAPQVRAGYWLAHSSHYSPPTQINTSLYTHVYYSALPLDVGSFHVAPPPPDQLPVLAAFSATLKNKDPYLKTLLSVSSSADQQSNSSSAFAAMAGSATSRAAFINSTIELARTYGFDGLDLAWLFPSSPSDMANLGFLLVEWRAAIEEEAKVFSPPLLLTATVYFSAHLFDGAFDNVDYPIQAIGSSLDWVNALCFGYHSSGDVTTADAALHDLLSHQSTSYGISSWLDAGLSPCKLVMGIPLYGRSWFLKNKMKNGMGAQVVAAGPKQKLSNQTGIMAYFEIEESLADPAAQFTYDDRSVASYFHTGDLWVSFDSPEVVSEKIAYASQIGLLGYFLWPISFDSRNYTISQQASDALQQNFASTGREGDGGYEDALTPVELPPLDLTSMKSTAIANSIQYLSAVHLCKLHSCYLFLHFALMIVQANLLYIT
ncbi:hypothetical protein Taro_004832 [Colocasia esculenta]|uniref:GH18 domain-containing protein n=1 Tax=Colocasia esculenta TaxID=4460 RepID=A0A843TLB1_COLES|nr:hypothetical protein [Colocasia esculenta]